MSWRSSLPTLPRAWRWVRYEPRLNMVLAHCCYGLWVWLDRDSVENIDRRTQQVLHRALRRAALGGQRGLCRVRDGALVAQGDPLQEVRP